MDDREEPRVGDIVAIYADVIGAEKGAPILLRPRNLWGANEHAQTFLVEREFAEITRPALVVGDRVYYDETDSHGSVVGIHDNYVFVSFGASTKPAVIAQSALKRVEASYE